MINTNDFQKAVGLINKAKRVLLTTHTRPDGDACGCIAAISETLTAIGKNVKILLLSELPAWYEFLFEQKPEISTYDILHTIYEPDLIVIVDTDSYNQLPGLDKYLKKLKTQNSKLKTPVLVIDHHVTDRKSEIRSQTPLSSVLCLIDNSAAATALIVFDLLKYAGWPITKKIAEALFVAVSTDTGWFQFSNTDSRVHRACAELIDAGANPSRVYRDLYQNFSPQRFKLMTAMLNTLELHFDGRYAVFCLLSSDFKTTGAKFSDTENLIDECRRISSVEATALFVELADGKVKVSLRSFSPFQKSDVRNQTPLSSVLRPPSSVPINVCKIAAKFGGGGHKMAAGAHLPGPIDKAKKLVLTEMAEQIEQST